MASTTPLNCWSEGFLQILRILDIDYAKSPMITEFHMWAGFRKPIEITLISGRDDDVSIRRYIAIDNNGGIEKILAILNIVGAMEFTLHVVAGNKLPTLKVSYGAIYENTLAPTAVKPEFTLKAV